MEKETRSAIERATQRARLILEADFAEQLQGDYDVMVDGRVGERPGVHLTGQQKGLRSRIVAALEHKRMAGMKPADAVADYIRDAAFTTLNRFVALKMLEARRLVQECITKGDASSGFVNEYLAFATGAKFADGSGYRLYIESIFDELSTEVKVLFDRRDAASALWPRRAAFLELLDILNASALAGVWAEDETIGWVYQYFNGQDERRAMRDASQAPRNSRELAVRNQFFTPRYVVQFLTDNTLGRIWYEMRGGETGLVEICEYMVRRPDEVWMPRANKDPRDLRVLDPACGSGHFLLYAFDLLVTIYQEAWFDPGSPPSDVTGATLRADYPDLDALKLAIPGLILAHNLHGVDIDPRCAQIAQLALWMRAQRAFREFGVDRAARRPIRRSNIVIAEPMPGEQDLRDEFLRELREDRLEGLMRRALDIPAGRPVHTNRAMADSLASLVGTVWDDMALAGDLGVLLKIERTLAQAIEKARAEWEADMPLFRISEFGLVGDRLRTESEKVVRLVPGEGLDFWGKAERLVLRALEDYADAASGAGVTRRRLFADDAAHGFALADLASKRFDVVLMNPPFGTGSLNAKKVFESAYSRSKSNLFAAFVERGVQMLVGRGRLGAITSRSGFFNSSLKQWREEVLLADAPPIIVADLGYGVLDGAKVEAAAYCLEAVW
ncbi:DNA methyltransferase [Mesorhizobium sp. M0586]|uniref:Eco57I restriction-modification methylase domain-containing protein n=1 Tax=unclassified Mesorhizobium TaxID=325217 RepID=UPI0033353D3F